MRLDEFNELFLQFAEEPLRHCGFVRHKNTRTLMRTVESAQLSLIRLGGRLSRPGCITHTLCFRHTFLRPIESDEPVATSLEPNDYPFKLELSKFASANPDDLRYRPMNLGNWPRDRIEFGESEPGVVQGELERFVDQLTTLVVPWVASMSPEVAAHQIATFGEDAWCERRWLEDYAKRLSQM